MGKINKGLLRMGALVVIVALVMMVAVPVLADNSTTTPPVALHTVQGKVINIISNTPSSSSFIIQNVSQQQVTITTDTSTKYYLINTGRAQSFVNNTVTKDNQQAKRNGRPQPPRANDLRNARIPANWRDNLGWLETFDTQANFSNIQVGDRVIARTTNDASNLAKQILIIKAPVNKTVKGTVNSVTVNPGSSTILSITPTGSTTPLSLNITAQTRIVLKGIAVIQQGQAAVAVYNSTNNNALTVNIQAAQP